MRTGGLGAGKAPGFGRPNVYSGNIDESKWGSMAPCTGRRSPTELIYHLGFKEILDTVRRTATVIPVMMPYITSEFGRRDAADGPLVIPLRARNFALLGQYVEIPDVVFPVEYSVRCAMQAVSGLLGLMNEIPPIYHGVSDTEVATASRKVLIG